MRIGFDVSQTAEEKAGCGFFADQLIRGLSAHDMRNEYLIYSTFYGYRNPNISKVTKPAAVNCRTHFERMSFEDMVLGWNERMTDRSQWLGYPDIVHSNNFSCVKDHNAKIMFTVYDVAPLACPEFTTEENRLICFDGLFNASIYADHCIAISEYTKKSFLSYFPHYPEERMTVIPLGTRSTLSPNLSLDRKREILTKFNITDEFWLGVGTIEPRKNYRLLIDAHHDLNDGRSLVIAGGKGWLESELNDRVNRSELRDKVKFLGYVTDEELSALYGSCFAFVYPSYYEGFGLPVLEAMSCGAGVIASNSSSLPEVGGDAAEYMDPCSKESLIEKMKYLINNPMILSELRSKSVLRAKKFSWDETAKKTLEAYEKTFASNSWFER